MVYTRKVNAMRYVCCICVLLSCAAFGQFYWLSGFAQHWLYEGDSIYDLNRDSIVDYQDFSFLSGIKSFVFTRNSKDVDSQNNIINDHEFVTKEFVLTSIPEWQEDSTATALQLLNYQETENFLWAVSTVSPRSVYRKPKLEQGDWVQVMNFSGMNYVFTDESHRVIIMAGAQPPTEGFISTDEGETWTEIVQMPEFNDGVFPVVGWNVVFHNDTVMMGEYKIAFPGYSDRMFRSTDSGIHWERVLSVREYFGYDADDTSPTTTTDPYPALVPFDLRRTTSDGVFRGLTHHCHAVGYHAGLGAWIASYGNAPNMMQFASFDNGCTWHLLYGNDPERGDLYSDVEFKTNHSQIGIQPIRLIDIGHPTKILCGGDTAKSLFLWDIPTGDLTQLTADRLTIYHSNGGHFYCFHKSQGLYYAFDVPVSVNLANTPNTPLMPKTLVSMDGIHWATYHQWPEPLKFNRQRYAGIAQNKIHVAHEGGEEKRWMLSVPKLSPYTGILIQSGSSNIISDTSLAQGKSDPVNDWESHHTILANYERVYSQTDGIFYRPGDIPGCLIWRTREDVDSRHWFRFNTVASRIPMTHRGKNPYVRFWYSGYTGQAGEVDELEQFTVYAHHANIPTTSLSPPGIPLRITSRGGGQWNEAIVPARVRPDEEFMRISLRASAGGSSAMLRKDENIHFLIDGMVVSDAPVSFIYADLERNKTHLTYLRQTENAWSIFFSIVPDTDYVSMRHPYEPWRNIYNYPANTYAVRQTGTGAGRLFKSITAPGMNDDPMAIEPSGKWGEVTCRSKLAHWHLKTLDFSHGNKLVLYLDTMPQYINGIEVNGRYLRLDVYIHDKLMETLSLTDKFVWDRRSQWNFALSCNEASGQIYWFATHSELQMPDKQTTSHACITAAVQAGLFTNRPVLHHHGDTNTMKSYCYYLIEDLNKHFDVAIADIEAIRDIMNDI